MVAPRAYITGRAIRVEFVDGTVRLSLQIIVDCPDCGQAILDLPGHHVRALRRICEHTMAAYPELCGDEPDAVDATPMSPGGTPEKPRMN